MPSDEKGVPEGPFAGPMWGSTDGEQDYADQGSLQVEHSSGGGEYLPAGAVLGAAGLVAEAEAAAKTARRSSIETTSNVTRSTKVASILPEVTVACFLLALLLVLVASAALLSWTTRRHARVVLIGQTTKKAFRPSNATYIIPPFNGKMILLGGSFRSPANHEHESLWEVKHPLSYWYTIAWPTRL